MSLRRSVLPAVSCPRSTSVNTIRNGALLKFNGTVYAAFYRWRATTGNFGSNTLVITSADVVVVRDDAWGAHSFIDLVEPPTPAGDGLAGKRVVQGVSFPFMV